MGTFGHALRNEDTSPSTIHEVRSSLHAVAMGVSVLLERLKDLETADASSKSLSEKDLGILHVEAQGMARELVDWAREISGSLTKKA
jgi:hypothetical protein